MELEDQMFEAERARLIHSWRDKALKAKLNEVEERERGDDIEGGYHVRFLGEKLCKVKESRVKHEVEVCDMETKTNKALEELRVDIIWFLPEEILDVIVRHLIDQFAKLGEKEDSLGEVLTLRMQDKKEVPAAIEKIRGIQKKTDMQGWNKYGTTKLKNYV